MVKIGPRVAPANMFVLSHDEAYAGTSRAEWEVIVNQGDGLKPVNLDDIEPENRECDICREPFGPSSDHTTRPEMPVSLPCGHIFGQDCLENWIDAGNGRDGSQDHDNRPDDNSSDEEWTEEETRPEEDDVDDLLPDSASLITNDPFSCPKCRAEHTILTSAAQNAPKIAARLRLWDYAYERLGIVRSVEEEACREDLWRFVSKTQLGQEGEDSGNVSRCAQVSAMRFAIRRAHRNPTPAQRHFLSSFFHLVCCHDANNQNDARDEEHGRPDAYENRPLPLWCWQFDRIERGMSPRPDSGPEGRQFHAEWQRQRMGPWSRRLFEQLKEGRLVYNSPEWWADLTESAERYSDQMYIRMD